MLEPAKSVVMSNSATSKPRAFSRRTRDSIRCISAAVELLRAGELGPQFAVAVLDHLHQRQRIEGLVEQPAGLEVAELAEQVGPGDGQVVLALPVRSAARAVRPVSASTRYAAKAPASRRNKVFDSETSPQRKPMRCSRASSTTIASTSRLTVSCRTPRLNNDRYGSENCRWSVIRIGSSGWPAPVEPVGDHPDGLHRRRVQPGEIPQQPVLVQGEVLENLLARVHPVSDPDEADHVPRDAARQAPPDSPPATRPAGCPTAG